MKKLLRFFIHSMTAIALLGTLILIDEGGADVYIILAVLGYMASSYYIETYKDNK